MVARRMEQAKSGEVTPLVNQMHVRPDGTRAWVEVTGIPCEYDGLPCASDHGDVTRRRCVERQVRRQRELLKKFFDRIPLVVVIFDSQGRIKMVNREWHRVLGWDSTGRISEILKAVIRIRTTAARRPRTSRGRRRDERLARLRGDGRTLTFSSAVFVLSDGARVGIGQDVTEKRASEGRCADTARARETSRDPHRGTGAEERRVARKAADARHVLATHERYRQLLAYEIHDTFVQDVTAAVMFLDVFYDLRSESGDQSLAPVEQARALLRSRSPAQGGRSAGCAP